VPPAVPPKTTPSATAAHRPQRVRRSRTWNIVLAIFFFLLGVVGIFIPVMPQILFFAMSAFFLSLVSRPVRRALKRFMHRHPKLAHRYNAWRHRRRLKRLERIRKARDLASRLHLTRD
jgi:uncharacterized protein